MHKLLLISVLALVPLAAGATARSADDTFSPEKGLDLSQSFAAQRDAIFAALADGETYAEIGAGDRQKVKQSLDRISGLLGDAQSVEQLSDSTRVEVFNEQELVNTLLTRAREDSRLVCTREKKVGSHRATTNCLTVAERRRLREETENALISNRGYKLPVSN